MRAVFVVCWLGVLATAHAERLPVRTYTTADGLANNHVDHGTRDSRGYLWFATYGGVSRFDGERFVNYGIAEGLPSETTIDVLAAHDGTIWAATDGGVAWLDPTERAVQPRFHAIAGPGANAIVEGDSKIWIGSEAGLQRFERGTLVDMSLGEGRQPSVISMAFDARDRSLWLGTWRGLLHRREDGSIERYRITSNPEDDRVFSVLVDHSGRVWIGHVGPYILGIPVQPGTPIDDDGGRPLWDVALERADWLHYEPHGWARRGSFEDSRGTIWIGTVRDVVRYEHGAFEEIAATRTGIDYAMAPCVEDSAGNVWFGSESGVHRLTHAGLVTFDRDDGLGTVGGSSIVYAFLQPIGAAVHVIVVDDAFYLGRRDGNRFTLVKPQLDPSWRGAWGTGQIVALDLEGRWWYPTSEGVVRYPKVERIEDLATATPQLFTTHDGLPGRDILRIFEDARHDLWFVTASDAGLARWDHTTGQITAVGAEWPQSFASAFGEDSAGTLWIGYMDGSLVRLRDGVPHVFRGGALPGGAFAWLLFDRDHHLWIASDHDGVVRVENPDADVLQTRRYLPTTSQGLTLVDDRFGAIYVGTTHGLDRIDPVTGGVTHFGLREGLPSENVFASLRERDGSLWFATKKGAVHLVPEKVELVAPPVNLERITVEGKPVPLLVGGEVAAPSLDLGADQNQVDVQFSAPSFVVGMPLRFAYRVDGGEWSAPSSDRFVHFAKLGAGGYQFEVRSVLPDGTASAPSSFAFEIQPPVWRRWWFMSLVALVLAALGYIFYRWRLAHALALERVRTRIASDLHDDLGASLSRISMLSEVASRRAANRDEISGPIDDIGRSARELVDVAADIVWSTDPMRDDLHSLIVRLREFAGDVLEARGIEWSLQAPEDPARIKLAPDSRRHLFLIIKEAVNNVAKHSHARRATIEIKLAGRGIRATVRDDGRGFDEATLARRGHGLDNMRTRAREAGGDVSMTTAPDAGTEIVCELPTT